MAHAEVLPSIDEHYLKHLYGRGAGAEFSVLQSAGNRELFVLIVFALVSFPLEC